MKTLRSACVLAAFLTVPPGGVDGAVSGPTPVTFSRVADNLYEIVGGRGARNAVFIGETGVLLIDTKMDGESMRQVLDGIRDITNKPVEFLINTHSDGDHITGNQYLPESITIISHENCRKELFHPLRDGSPSGWDDPALTPFLPEVCFSDSMSLNLGKDRIELYYFGIGHTSGDAVVYFPGMKIAVIGDQYAGGTTPYIHDFKGGSAFGYIKNLEMMLATLDADIYLSGHSAPVGKPEIEAEIREMKQRIQAVKDMIVRGMKVEEAVKGLDRREALLTEAIYNEVKSQK